MSTTIFVMIIMTWTSLPQTHLYRTPQFSEHMRAPRAQDTHSLSFASLEAVDVTTALSAIYSAFIYSYKEYSIAKADTWAERKLRSL